MSCCNFNDDVREFFFYGYEWLIYDSKIVVKGWLFGFFNDIKVNIIFNICFIL